MLTSHQKRHSIRMKSLFRYLLAFFFIFFAFSFKVHAFENESILDESQIIIANKYAERFCSAKADHYFEGLDNEKTLKYSFYKYIGLDSEEMYLNDMYQTLINQIRDKCFITNEEETEISALFKNKT